MDAFGGYIFTTDWLIFMRFCMLTIIMWKLARATPWVCAFTMLRSVGLVLMGTGLAGGLLKPWENGGPEFLGAFYLGVLVILSTLRAYNPPRL